MLTRAPDPSLLPTTAQRSRKEGTRALVTLIVAIRTKKEAPITAISQTEALRTTTTTTTTALRVMEMTIQKGALTTVILREASLPAEVLQAAGLRTTIQPMEVLKAAEVQTMTLRTSLTLAMLALGQAVKRRLQATSRPRSSAV